MEAYGGIKRPACNLLLAEERKSREATVGPNEISIPIDTMAMKLLGDIQIRELNSNFLEECLSTGQKMQKSVRLLKTSCKRFLFCI